MTDYCSYPLSLALKKAGFDEPCNCYYYMETTQDGTDIWRFRRYADMVNRNTNGHGRPRKCSAPTLWQAQKWLREAKGIYAYPEINALKKWFARAVDMKRNEDLLFDGAMFDTYEEAQSYAISYALQLLDNEKE